MVSATPVSPLPKPVGSPIVAVSSDRAGMEAFFFSKGLRYIQSDIYEDGRARADARRAAHQFGAFKYALLCHPEMRGEEWVEELMEACLSKQPEIAERGVIDELAICFINDVIGYGCFVQRDVREGEQVGLYTGIISEAARANQVSSYVMSTNPWYSMIPPNAMMGLIDAPGPWPKMVVDAEKAGNELRFANHIEEGALLMGTRSSAANLNVQSYFHYHRESDGLRGLFHVVCVASRNIEAGEELRFDYGPDYWENQGVEPASTCTYCLTGDRLVEVPLTS